MFRGNQYLHDHAIASANFKRQDDAWNNAIHDDTVHDETALHDENANETG